LRSNTLIEGSAAMIKILTTRITVTTGLPHTNYKTSIRTDYTLTFLLPDSTTRSSTEDGQDPVLPSGHTHTPGYELNDI